MILTYIINALFTVLASLLSVFPSVTALPFGIDSFLITSVGQIYTITQLFWPLIPVFNCLIFYIPIKVALWTLKLVLGSHNPIDD